MAFSKNNNKEITYTVHDDFDFILDEGGNSSVNLRKVEWNENGKPKLEIRRWTYQDGKERAGKGCTLTDAAANELTAVLCENGYGDTKRILDSLKERDDYKDALEGKEETYYDPNELFDTEE